MILISQIVDLKAISGGCGCEQPYTYDEFVTANTIFYKSNVQPAILGVVAGFLVYIADMGSIAAVAFGTVSAILAYNGNAYSGIEPNSWVTWNATTVCSCCSGE